jgi:hypothetical protein
LFFRFGIDVSFPPELKSTIDRARGPLADRTIVVVGDDEILSSCHQLVYSHLNVTDPAVKPDTSNAWMLQQVIKLCFGALLHACSRTSRQLNPPPSYFPICVKLRGYPGKMNDLPSFTTILDADLLALKRLGRSNFFDIGGRAYFRNENTHFNAWRDSALLLGASSKPQTSEIVRADMDKGDLRFGVTPATLSTQFMFLAIINLCRSALSKARVGDRSYGILWHLMRLSWTEYTSYRLSFPDVGEFQKYHTEEVSGNRMYGCGCDIWGLTTMTWNFSYREVVQRSQGMCAFSVFQDENPVFAAVGGAPGIDASVSEIIYSLPVGLFPID